MSNVASRIIAKCGGPQAVADMLGVHVSRCHRWTYPRDRGGSGGFIPAKRHGDLIVAARAKGIDLRPEDFFDLPTEDAA